MGRRTLRRGLRAVASNRIEVEASFPLCTETHPSNIHTPCSGRGVLTGGCEGVGAHMTPRHSQAPSGRVRPRGGGEGVYPFLEPGWAAMSPST